MGCSDHPAGNEGAAIAAAAKAGIAASSRTKGCGALRPLEHPLEPEP